MRVKHRYIQIMLACLLTIPGISYSASSLVSMAQLQLVTEEVPPMQIQLAGQARGYVIDFLRELIDEAARQEPMEIASIEFLPWRRAMIKAETEHNILFFSISRIPARERKFHWIGEVAPYEVVLYRHITGPDIYPSSLQELKAFRIGSQSGGSFDQYFSRQGFNLSLVSYNRQTISMLRLGRIDFAPQVSGSFFYRLEAMNEPAEDYLPVIRVDELSKDLWLVASKSTASKVVHALRNAYHILKQQGRLQQLYDAYHPDSPVMLRYRQARKMMSPP